MKGPKRKTPSLHKNLVQGNCILTAERKGDYHKISRGRGEIPGHEKNKKPKKKPGAGGQSAREESKSGLGGWSSGAGCAGRLRGLTSFGHGKPETREKPNPGGTAGKHSTEAVGLPPVELRTTSERPRIRGGCLHAGRKPKGKPGEEKQNNRRNPPLKEKNQNRNADKKSTAGGRTNLRTQVYQGAESCRAKEDRWRFAKVVKASGAGVGKREKAKRSPDLGFGEGGGRTPGNWSCTGRREA